MDAGDGSQLKPQPPERGPSGALSLFILCCFVFIFTLVSVTAFLQKSPTMDEPLHLFAGYSYLKWGDFRTNPEHPPFAKMWAALPLVALNVNDPRPARALQWNRIQADWVGLSVVDVVYAFFFSPNGGGERLFFYAKLQMIVLAILLGVFVYFWTKEIFGFVAALAALVLYALDPNILAHSQIVHTDVPFAALFFIGSYFFWCALNRLTWMNALFTSVFFALAAVTKYSAFVILPIWAVVGFTKIFFACSDRCEAGIRRKKAIELLGVLVAAALTAYFFTWAIYGFRYDAIAGGAHPLAMDRVLPGEGTLFRRVADFVIAHRLLPEAWIYGQLHIFKFLARQSFLLGQVSEDGFWSYFPIAFLVKTPLATIILLVAALWLIARGRIDRTRAVFLLIPPAAYFALAVWSRANLGVRYILPIYPFLFVLAGAAAAALWQEGRWMRRGAALLGMWLLWSCVWTYPHYLAYFNELVGGPKNGYKVLLDSNLDWGQDLKGLKRWMDANGVKKIRFLYFGWVDPEYYGIDASYIAGAWAGYDPPATQSPEPYEYVAMSAHLLYGLERENKSVKAFRSREPLAVIGHSIFVFKLGKSQ
jgi:dolichyl-phosphate-mannose-protein mannosyltransferase